MVIFSPCVWEIERKEGLACVCLYSKERERIAFSLSETEEKEESLPCLTVLPKSSLQHVAFVEFLLLLLLLFLLSLNRNEELELGWDLIFGVKLIRKVNPSDTAVGMDLNPQGFHIVRTIGSPCEIREVELDLIPTLVQTHGHGAYEGLHSSLTLVCGSTKTSSNILVV